MSKSNQLKAHLQSLGSRHRTFAAQLLAAKVTLLRPSFPRSIREKGFGEKGSAIRVQAFSGLPHSAMTLVVVEEGKAKMADANDDLKHEDS